MQQQRNLRIKRMEEGYYDCSSLVYRLYKEVGIELPYVADTQGYYCFENAMLINQEDLMPGDLIFYSDEENGCFRNVGYVFDLYRGVFSPVNYKKNNSNRRGVDQVFQHGVFGQHSFRYT